MELRKSVENMLRLNGLEITREVVLNYFNDYKERFAYNTIRQYSYSLAQFFEFSKIDYVQITTKDIRAYLLWLEEEGNKGNTIRQKLNAIRSFYYYCLEEKLITKNPTTILPIPKSGEGKIKYIDRPTLARLMELTKNEPIERAMIATLYATGVRVSELMRIRLDDINWEERQITIRHGKGNKDRTVLFTVECAERLKDYLTTLESPFLFSRTAFSSEVAGTTTSGLVITAADGSILVKLVVWSTQLIQL